jgi:hypothetical protein
MTLLGFGDLKDQEIHALWNLDELKRLQLRDGTTFDQIVREAQDVANAVSSEITRVAPLNALFAVQTDPAIEYGTFTGGKIQRMTEYSVPDPFRGQTTGHMLPIDMFVRTLGWTQLSLENRRSVQLKADLDVLIDDIRQHYADKVLHRFFKMEAEAVGDLAGASVPFADGGVADSKWVPMRSPEGTEFANTHDHYLRHDAINDANVLAALKHLKEHGHQSPYDLLAAAADAASYAALTGWRAPQWENIVYRDTSSGTDRAAFMGVEDYNGLLEIADVGVVRVKFMERIPTGYYAVFKNYGAGNAKAPMRMRIDEFKGFGWSVVPGNYVNAPLTLAALRAEWDIGIGEDRTNAVLVYINASGDYVSPTIWTP